MNRLLLLLTFSLFAESAWSQGVLDQQHLITQSVGGLGAFQDFSIAQTFTAQRNGLLSRVDLQLGRDAGDIGALTLDLLPVVNGVPSDVAPLFSAPIATQDIPVESPSANLDFTSVDVSASAFAVVAGQQYALSLRAEAGFSDPNAFWNRGFPGYDAGASYDNPFGRGWEPGPEDTDFGFRTFVSPIGRRLPVGDYNGDAFVNAADYATWRTSLGTGSGPADGNGDGSVNQADYELWQTNFGVHPDTQTRNGGFVTGGLTEWGIVIEENTNVSFGFPRVESFDTNGDGTADEAVRFRLGVVNFGPDERGTAGIEQEILLEGGDYTFSADIATQSLEVFGNTGPGDYELLLNGTVIDSVNLNGTLIEGGEVIRDSLSATVSGLEPGFHTLGLVVSRRATNTREIYHFFDNLTFTRTAAAVAVPDPTTLALGVVGVCLAGGRRERRSERVG